MARQFLNFINGEFVLSKGGEFFENRNASHRSEILGLFPRSRQSDVDDVVRSAKESLLSWKSITPPSRGKILFKACEILEQKKEKIADAILAEMGKPKASALGDVQSGIDLGRYAAGEGRRLFGNTTFSELANRSAQTRRVPVGVCALITPWNAPMAAIAWKVFPALICGNTVVLKPAADTPWTAHFLAEALSEAGLPKGVFNLVYGFGNEAGQALVNHKDINLVSFTGSTETGIDITKACSERLIKVSLEMGGKNAVLVLDDADIDLAVSSTISGAFSLAGQRCAATSRAIVHEAVYQEYMQKLIEKTRNLKIGPADQEGVDVIPVINEAQFNKVKSFFEKAKSEGITPLVGGTSLYGGAYDQAYYIAPTIYENVPLTCDLWRKEIFGPVLSVVKCASFEQGLELVNDCDFGLIASVFTRDIVKANRAIDNIRTGVVYINAPTFGSEVHLPFGGFGLSGNGHREPGLGSIDVFSEWQTIYVDYSGQVQNSQTGLKK